jgi:hypothetical protein
MKNPKSPIPMKSQAPTSKGVVLERIAADPAPLEARRRAGLHRVRSLFTWKAKAEQVLELYRWVLGKRADRPDFGMPFPDVCPDWA